MVFKKGNKEYKKRIQVWNKGLTKETDKRMKSISRKQKRNAKINHNFGMKGKNQSSEMKRKMVETRRKNNSWIHTTSIQTRKKISKSNKGKHFCSDEKKKMLSELNSNPNSIVCHHINGNHFDNRLENKIFITRKEHNKIHLLQGDYKIIKGVKGFQKNSI